MERRSFLTAAGTTAAIALSGCFGDGTTDDPESIIEEYYELVQDAARGDDLDGVIASLEDIAHPTSPIPDWVEEDFDDDDYGDGELESVQTEIVEANLEKADLEEIDWIYLWLEEYLDDLAALENRIVGADVEWSGDEVEPEYENYTERWFVVEEDGDWLLVISYPEFDD